MQLPKLRLLSLLSFILFTTATAAAAAAPSLTITIPSSNILPNPHILPAGTHATLTTLPSSSSSSSSKGQNHILTAPLTRSSTFVFRNLQPESYLLDIRSPEYVFAPYRVDVSADGSILGVWETFRGNPWDNRGADKFVASTAAGDASASASSPDVTVEAKVLARRNFYEQRSTFSPLGLFKNPMILLALVALGITVGMPKLMENMDPEMRAEFEKQSRSSPISGATRNAMAGGSGGPANFDLAGWMAGAAPGPMANPDAAGTSTSTGRESGSSTRRRG